MNPENHDSVFPTTHLTLKQSRKLLQSVKDYCQSIRYIKISKSGRNYPYNSKKRKSSAKICLHRLLKRKTHSLNQRKTEGDGKTVNVCVQYLDEYFSQTDRWGAEFCQEHHTLEIIPFSLSPELGKEKKRKQVRQRKEITAGGKKDRMGKGELEIN